MKILYLITTFNPRDNNKNYFKDTGYPYRAIESVLEISKHSSHTIDIYIVDCASGQKTRDEMISRRKSKGYNIKFLFGPDLSGLGSINKACKLINKEHVYDYMIFSASDAILQNPHEFDAIISDLNASTGCGLAYFNAQPGLELPKQSVDAKWFDGMSMHDAVHYNAFCVTKEFLKYYDNRVIFDVLESGIEVLLGYYCHAAGFWRKICKLNYLHLPKTGIRTDRKTAYTNTNLCRGNGFYLVPSFYTKRSLVGPLKSEEAIRAGVFFETPVLRTADKHNMLSELNRLSLEAFVQKYFVLHSHELDYNSINMDIC